MSLEGIAALMGHRSLDMTRRHARIANRAVASEYDAVSRKVEALYDQPLATAAEGPNMLRLRTEHERMLGNGYCNRTAALDYSFERHLGNLCLLRHRPRVPSRPVASAPPPERHERTSRAELFSRILDDIDITDDAHRRRHDEEHS
jgi:hypothetical protein